VTLVEPTGSDETVSFALPPLSCAVPSTVFPAVKVTGPVGITVGDEIFAVKVTCPSCNSCLCCERFKASVSEIHIAGSVSPATGFGSSG
jgi:hypothetical protein